MSSLTGVRLVPRRPEFMLRMFHSLRVRNYRLWFIGQTISQSGTWMQSVAQGWLVIKLTGSAVDLGLTAALQFGPVLFMGAYGGLIADRFDKRKVLLATQSAFTAQALALGILVATGSIRLWMVWVLAAIMGLINGIDSPSRQSFVVEMVGADDLANAVGLNSVIVNGSRIIGPAIAGILIATAGMTWTFMLNALSFGAVIGGLYAMRSVELHRLPPVARAKGQIRAGFRYAWANWELRVPLLIMAVVGTLAYNFSVILPLFADDVFHRGGGTLGELTTAMGIGALIGALIAAARRRPNYRLLVLVTFLFGVFILAVAVAPTLPLTLLMLVPMGTASVLFMATGNSLLQLYASPAMRGRVMALWAIVFLGSTPIGAPLTGVIASRYGTRFALGLGGVATLAIAVVATLMLRRIRADNQAAAAVRDAAQAPRSSMRELPGLSARPSHGSEA